MTNLEIDTKEQVEKYIGNVGIGVRHLQILLLFFGIFITYALRVNLSLAIVAMTDNTTKPDFNTFDWDESTRSIILSSFFWGYIFLQIPAGMLAQRYGGKILFLLVMVFCSFLTLLTPIGAMMGWPYLVGIRLLQGLFQGCTFPALHTLLANWVHPIERGFLVTIVNIGGQAGTILMLAISGYIAASPFGWPGIFYFSGGFGVLFCVAYLILGSDSPSKHKTISNDEKIFLENVPGLSQNHNRKTPWKKICTSPPVIVLFWVNVAYNWGFWTLMTLIPSYINGVLGLDIKSNAVLSSCPYLAMLVLSLIVSKLSDFVIESKILSMNASRKLFNTIGFWIPAVSLLGLVFISKEQITLAISLLTIAVGFLSASYVGFFVNHLDLAPNFAGVLIAITNGLGNCSAFFGPLFAGFIVTDMTNNEQWHIVFLVSAGLLFAGSLLFLFFGQTNIQSWNEEKN